MEKRENYLDLHVWSEKEGGLYGSWHYAMMHKDSFVGGGSTPTISTSKNFWEEVVETSIEIMRKKNLEECCLHDGKVPPLEEWSNANALSIPVMAHNHFLLKLPVNNPPALP